MSSRRELNQLILSYLRDPDPMVRAECIIFLFIKGGVEGIDIGSVQLRYLTESSNPEDSKIAAYIIGARPKYNHRAVFLRFLAPYGPICSAVVSRNISKYIRKVNPKASAYWLRHTYAQNLLESGASIFEIKEMLGHDSIESTEKYLCIHTNLMRKVIFNERI